MKLILLPLFLVFYFSCAVVGQNAPGIEWEKSLGGNEWEYGRSIHQTTDGGFIAIGTANSDDGDVTDYNGVDDYWIVKLNSNGNWRARRSRGRLG